MATNGIWNGCGHPVKMILLCADALCMSVYAEFLNDNPKDLCFRCWKEDTGRSE